MENIEIIKASKIEQIKKFPKDHSELLERIIERINKILENKRKIMYSDVIRTATRAKLDGEDYNNLILWCNYNIRLGRKYL